MDQVRRGCRHVVATHYWVEHPKYGDKVPYSITRLHEVQCDKSCGQRDAK